MKPHLLLSLVALLSAGPLQSQLPDPRPGDFNDFLEALAGETPDEEETPTWMEELRDKADHPVNINTADREELLDIPFITEEAAATLLSFRERYGPFYSIYELASLPGMNREMVMKISFFITTGAAETPTGADTLRWGRGYHDLLLRGNRTFPLARGFTSLEEKPPAYPGNPMGLYVRYRFEKRGSLQAGITADKDPGEPLLGGSGERGFDHTSGFVSFKINDLIPRVILGDFTAGTGQGGVIWQGFTMSGSTDILQGSKNLTYIKPHTSSDENRFFRGVAVAFHHHNHRLHLFLSSRKRDANLEERSDSSLVVSSLPASGYHRTPSERETKNAVRESTGALFYRWARPGLKAGVTAMASLFSLPMEPGHQLYERYYFRGERVVNAGCDYRWIRGNFQFFGEAALSCPGGQAFIQGLEARLHDQLAVVLSFRHFDRDYHALWGGAFAAHSRCANETGLYAALRLLPAPGLSLTASADWHRSPWILYTTAGPSTGSLTTLRADLHPSSRISGYLRYRSKTYQKKTTPDALYRQETIHQHNLRLQTDYSPHPALALRWRIEGIYLDTSSPEKGILLCHDIAWKPQHIPLTSSFRTAWFHTSSTSSAIYTFENDLLYSFSSLTCYGHGLRNYLNLKIHLANHLDAWVKMGLTTWFDRSSTGSGNDLREGNCKRELKMQVRYHF